MTEVLENKNSVHGKAVVRLPQTHTHKVVHSITYAGMYFLNLKCDKGEIRIDADMLVCNHASW